MTAPRRVIADFSVLGACCSGDECGMTQEGDCKGVFLGVGEPCRGAFCKERFGVAAGGPRLLEKVANFAVAAAGHIAAGVPMASDDEIARRYAICAQCEFLVNDSCAKCGCGVSRIRGYVSKLSWADQECPVGKWGKQKHPKEGAPPTS